MGLTRQLGEFVAGLKFEHLPPEAVRMVRVGFIDCAATTIASQRNPAIQILQQVLSAGPGLATLYFSKQNGPAPEAALINGTAAHDLDFDDVAMSGHPSAVLVSAILAEGEVLNSPGVDMITAYIAGYEVWAELFWRERDFLHEKGWHPTGIFGAVAAAAACAKLRGLDASRASQALAIGASHSAGLVANFGTMTKPLHAGRAAQAGLIAARLAAADYTASPTAIEHPTGLLNAVSPQGDVDRETFPADLGRKWRIVSEGLSIKRYPTCYCTHRALDGLLELMHTAPFAASDVSRITVTLSEKQASILANHRPMTGTEAKFSIEFAMSSAIVARTLGLAQMDDGFVQRADIQSVMGRVHVCTNTNYDKRLPGASVFDQVIVEFHSGERRTGRRVRRPRGHMDIPLSTEELFQKFRDCLAFGQAEFGAEALFERLTRLEDVSARHVTRAC